MYELGIMGGMGPVATAEIFRRIIDYTDAKSDQEHLSICILNKAQIPDRTNYLLHNGPSPLKMIKEGIEELKALGVKKYVIPCNTSHAFINLLPKFNDMELINMVEETKSYINKHFNKQMCILATDGTVRTKVYGDYTENVIYPDSLHQEKIMEIIYAIKRSNKSIDNCRGEFLNIIKEIHCKNNNIVFIIACTELSLLMNDYENKDIICVDAMDVVAVQAILKCGYRVRKQSTNIIVDDNL